ncbi:phenoloxidase-activating factor 2-like [Drosophila busckii]|uniref:phenoloxidase-activating factor 2-like n=1 Tax=Drosophila busckii TaxID=30019 RepID=UPI00143292B8|nr:phenoloxidase-activating factor 2-like [Drosophila busckii]
MGKVYACLILLLLCYQNYVYADCGTHSTCVLSWQCVKKADPNVINFRSVDSDVNAICKHKLQVCCPNADIIKQEMPMHTNVACGKHNFHAIQQDHVNENTQFAEFPWVMAVITKSPIKFMGGGSLLAPNVVLTAAHKLLNQSAEDLQVRAGDWNIMNNTVEGLAHVNRAVAQVILHEQFDIKAGTYDIALLILQHPIAYSAHIQPICLPRKYEFLDLKRCFMAGWGTENFDTKGGFSEVMRKVDLPYMKRAECEEKMKATKLSNSFKLHETTICAGGEAKQDACTNDGGSPLFCPLADLPNQYFQLGIVSWGLDCGVEGVPGAYTNVYYLKEWIHSILHLMGLDPNQYMPAFTLEYFKRTQDYLNKEPEPLI